MKTIIDYRQSDIISEVYYDKMILIDRRGEKIVLELPVREVRSGSNCCGSKTIAVYVSCKSHTLLMIAGCRDHWGVPYEVARLCNLKPVHVYPFRTYGRNLHKCLLCLEPDPNYFCFDCAKQLAQEIQRHPKKCKRIFGK